MYSTKSYRAFHSSELATEDDIWTTLGDLHELKAEECAVDGILSFEFEIRTVMSPKKNFTVSVSEQGSLFSRTLNISRMIPLVT